MTPKHFSLKSLLSTALVASAALLVAAPAKAVETYAFDKAHTNILFAINHLGLSEFYGQFQDFDGTVTFDPADPTKSAMDVTIQATSVDTDVAALDEHLRNEDFFNVAQFPEITFKTTEIRRTGETTGEIVGELTMLGVTKPVTLDATMNFNGTHPLSGVLPYYKDAHYLAVSAETVVKRSDFGMTYLVPNVGDEVKIIIETELRRQ
ncbi:MAG: YceI family protein [Alphaproteobacteria bacterium]|nr:YceI family protein [Alphaproteobacteria bacterium]